MGSQRPYRNNLYIRTCDQLKKNSQNQGGFNPPPLLNSGVATPSTLAPLIPGIGDHDPATKVDSMIKPMLSKSLDL